MAAMAALLMITGAVLTVRPQHRRVHRHSANHRSARCMWRTRHAAAGDGKVAFLLPHLDPPRLAGATRRTPQWLPLPWPAKMLPEVSSH